LVNIEDIPVCSW